MKHFAKAGFGGAEGAGILEPLCKSGPRRSRGAGLAGVWSGETSGKPFAEESRAGLPEEPRGREELGGGDP